MAKADHKGQPSRIRRNVQRYGDPYIPKGSQGEIAVCARCQAIYKRRHWFFDEELLKRAKARATTRQVTCPACQKIEDNYPEGEVVLRGEFLGPHRNEIMNLVSNEEERAKGLNPLERIVRISESNGTLSITTTNEKLAQRIGRALQKAYQGDISYRWSEDTKYLHVEWAR
jgi:NMD protein affecting ribosome stability and mRNA decay